VSNRYQYIVDKHLTVVLAGLDENMCVCPFCGGRSSLQFNSAKGLWICFRCGSKGDAERLVEKLGEIWTEFDFDFDESDPFTVVDAVTALPLSESYLRRFNTTAMNPHPYWRLKRKFTRAICDKWELGFDALTERVTIPVRDTHTRKLKGIIFRTLDTTPGDYPRYQNPAGFQKSNSLFGSWHATAADINSVCLVEGPLDAVTVDQAGVNVLAQYGSSLSVRQVAILHSLGIKNICLFYDFDDAGVEATLKSQQQLKDFNVTRVTWNTNVYCPENKEKCSCINFHQPDPGILRGKEIRRMVREAHGNSDQIW
jgi:DNA primase